MAQTVIAIYLNLPPSIAFQRRSFLNHGHIFAAGIFSSHARLPYFKLLKKALVGLSFFSYTLINVLYETEKRKSAGFSYHLNADCEILNH
jgi:hypothetical protein